MTKIEFILALNDKLSGIPQDEIQERLEFYSEMIDDRMEEGLSEDEAVSDIGSIDDIARQILEETPLIKIVKDKIKPKRKIAAWEIVLLAVGSPIWLALLVSAFSVLLSLYIVAWSLIISLWSVFGALAGSSIGGFLSGIVLTVMGNGIAGVSMICAGVVCAGLAIFMFFGSKAATKGILGLTKKIVLSIKKRFIKKEEA